MLVPGERAGREAALSRSLPKKKGGRQPAKMGETSLERALIEGEAGEEMGQEGDGKLCPRRDVPHRVAPSCP